MNQHWRNLARWGRLALAVLLVVSLTVIVVHWHQDARGQDCGLCNAQQMPSLLGSVGNLLIVPVSQEWITPVREVIPVYSEVVRLQRGRAPPQALLSL